MKLATTSCLRRIVKRSEVSGFSRLPSDRLWQDIDPKGKHLLQESPANWFSGFVRTYAMCKLKDRANPGELWIDVSRADWDVLSDVPEDVNASQEEAL
jgi:hypothetical protein